MQDQKKDWPVEQAVSKSNQTKCLWEAHIQGMNTTALPCFLAQSSGVQWYSASDYRALFCYQGLKATKTKCQVFKPNVYMTTGTHDVEHYRIPKPLCQHNQFQTKKYINMVPH